MKIVFYFLIVSVCFSVSVHAHEKQAFLAASAFVSKNFSISNLKSAGENHLRLVYTDAGVVNTKSVDNALYYVYNVGERGFVIISNQEVVGYNQEELFNTDVVPEALRWFLKRYVDNAAHTNIELKSIEGIAEIVSPLLKSRWGQAFPFSNETPIVEGRSTACGCVATAMAQIMYYWEWPEQGHGEKEYISKTHKISLKSDFSRPFRWDRMRDSYNRDDKEGISYEEVDEISYLLQQCGIISEMDYTTFGSGASPSDAVLGMARYFDYKQTTLRSFSTSEMDEDQFMSLLKKELDMKRPVLSAGGGHEFVCDGYDSNDYFHFDWGEYGYDNGFFKINGDHAHIGPHELSVITGIIPNNVEGEAVAPVGFQSESLTLDSQPEYIGDDIEFSYSYEMNILGGDTLEYGIAWIEPSTNEILEVYGVKKISPMVYSGNSYHRFKILEPVIAKTIYTFTPVKKEKGSWQVISPDKNVSVELSPKALTPVELTGYCSVWYPEWIFDNQESTLSVNIANNGMTPYQGYIKIELIDLSGKIYDVIESELSSPENSSQNDNEFSIPYMFRKAGEYMCRVSVKEKGRLIQLENIQKINVTERKSVPVISFAKINTSLNMNSGFGNGVYEEIRGNQFTGTFVLRNDSERNIEGSLVLHGSKVLFSERVRIPIGSSETISFQVKADEGDNEWMSLTPYWKTNDGKDYDLTMPNSSEYHYSIRLLDRKDDDQVVFLASGGINCGDLINEFPRLTDTSLGISVDASSLTESTWSGSFRLFLYKNGILVGTEDLMQDITLQKGTGYAGNHSLYSTLPEGRYDGKICYRSKNSPEWTEMPAMDGVVHTYPITVLPPVISLSADYSIVDGEEYSIPSNEAEGYDGSFFSFRYCLSNLTKLDYIGELALYLNDKQVSQPVPVMIKGERAERKTGTIRLDLSGMFFPVKLELKERQTGSLDFVKIDDYFCRNYAVLQKSQVANTPIPKKSILYYYDRTRDVFVLTGMEASGWITVFSVDGRIRYQSGVSGTQCSIPVSGWPKGVYVLLLNGKSYRIMK